MLTLTEYLMKDPLPLARVQEAILDFCRGRADVCVFGAQAVVQHSRVPRMTQDVDLMARDPEAVANELAHHLGTTFPHLMASRVRAVQRGDRVLGYRVYQRRSEEHGGNRHLADVRALEVPENRLVTADGIQYTDATLTLAMKVHAAAMRSDVAKRFQDQADVVRLISAMPDIGITDLQPLWDALGAPPTTRTKFEELRAQALAHETSDEDDFY